jgi:hypothetical protein
VLAGPSLLSTASRPPLVAPQQQRWIRVKGGSRDQRLFRLLGLSGHSVNRLCHACV